MNKLDIGLKRGLTDQEYKVLTEICEKLENTFGEKVYSVNVRPNNKEKDRVWGIAFAFDLKYSEE